MAEKLDWVFESIDRFSGPIGGMTTGLAGFALGLNSATELVMKLSEGLSFITEKAVDFTKFGLDAVSFKESTLVGFETILKSKQEAMALFKNAQMVADYTPFTTKSVVESYKQLLGAGFDKEEVKVVFAAVGDMASFQSTKGEMNQVMQSVTNDMAIMMAKGQVDFRHLQWLAQSTKGIITMQGIATSIGKRMGVSSAEAFAMMHSGAITARQGVQGVVDAMAAVNGDGKVGSSVLKNASTMKGLLSTFESLKENFFFAMGEGGEATAVKGISEYKGALQNVINYFNVAGASGKRVAADLEMIFGSGLKAVFGDLSGDSGLNIIPTVMGRVLDFIEKVNWEGIFGTIRDVVIGTGETIWAVFSGVIDVLRPAAEMFSYVFSSISGDGGATLKLLKGVGYALGAIFGLAAVSMAVMLAPLMLVVEGVAGLASLVSQLDWSEWWSGMKAQWDVIANFWTGAWETARQWGANIINGLVAGIKAGAGAVWDALTGVSQTAQDATQDKNKMRSPSLVFQEYGGFLTAGLVRGVEGGTDDVTAAIQNMTGGKPSGIGASPSSGGFSFSDGAIRIEVDAKGMDGEGLARKLAELLPSHLAMAFEGMAMEGGVA